MNKQALIEKAVLAFEGKWLFPYENLVTPSPTNTGYAPHSKFESIKDLVSLGPHWSFVCTKEEFEACAKRMGYINGYRWGVEYPINRKKPDLPDDVIVCFKTIEGDWDLNGGRLVWMWNWAAASGFKITDPRYKPVSEISESNPDTESVSENPESNWFEVGEFPPAGTVCEVNTCGVWHKTKIVGMNGKMCVYVSKDFERVPYNGDSDHENFRPIKTDRERFIDAAEAAFKVSGFDKLTDFGFLHDAGFRLPESK